MGLGGQFACGDACDAVPPLSTGAFPFWENAVVEVQRTTATATSTSRIVMQTSGGLEVTNEQSLRLIESPPALKLLRHYTQFNGPMSLIISGYDQSAS